MASRKREDDMEHEVVKHLKVSVGRRAFNQFVKIQSNQENRKIDNEYKKTLSEKWHLLNRTEKAQYSVSSSGDLNDTLKISKDTSKDSNFMATRCSPKKFIDVVSKFSKDQIVAVNEMGFGTLLKLSCSRLRHDLCRFLVEKLDADNHSIEFHDTVLSISSSDFKHILSVPEGGTDLDFSSCSDSAFKDVFVGKSGNISIAFVIQRLEESKTVDDDFRVSFVLMVLGTLLCPATSTSIDEKYILPLRDPKKIKNLNWASYAFKFLVESVRSFKEKKSRYMCGCVLFLQLYYYNSIAYGRVITNCSKPPVTVWGDSESSKLIKHVHKKGGYGSADVNLVPRVDTVNRHEHEVGDISSLKNDIESWKNVACHIQNSVNELKGVVVEFREESKKAVADLKANFNGTVITTALGEFQEGILKAVNELKVSVQQLNEKVLQNGMNNASAQDDFHNFQHDEQIFESPSAKEDHHVQAHDHILKSYVKEDVATPSCKMLSDDHVEAPERMVKQRVKKESTSSSEISPMNLRRTMERKPGHQILSPFTSLDDLETAGKKLDLLNEKLTEVKKRKWADIGPFKGCRDLYDDDLYLIAFVFLDDENSEFRVFETDRFFINCEGMKCLEPEGLVSDEIINGALSLLMDQNSSTWYYTTYFSDEAIKAAKEDTTHLSKFATTAQRQFKAVLKYETGIQNAEKIFIPFLDRGTSPHHWFFIVIKLAELRVEIWDTCPSQSRNGPREDLVYLVLLAMDAIFDTQIRKYFSEEWSFSSFTVFSVDNICIQKNIFDCGIHLLRYIINYDSALEDELDSINQRVQLALWMLKHPRNLALAKVMKALGDNGKTDGANKEIKTEATQNCAAKNFGKSSSKVVQKKPKTRKRAENKREDSPTEKRGPGRPRGATNIKKPVQRKI